MKPRRRYRPALEPVEPRLLLTAFAYFVDALTDTGAGTGFSGDLRYAITQANLNPGSTITIDTSGTVDLTSALPDIAVDMSIGNPDPGDFLLQGGGNGSNYRALTIDSDVSAIVSGIDFTNFATTGNGGILMVDGSLGLVASDLSLSSASSGGAVYISTQGSLTANGCSFHDNSSLNSGGAIDCDNDLNLIGGSLLNNSAGGSGGAVSVDGLMNAYGVEIAGNVASNLGGGIEASDGMGPSGLTITNSTIAENAAENVGGGVMCFISPTFTNDTIAGNSSAVSQGGAGLYIYAGVQPLLKNTLIAQNLSNDIESDVDGMGPTASIDSTSSFNLIGNTSVSGITDGTQGNQIGSGSPLDAELGPLTNNGGTNETIAPNAGSPAIAAGLIANAVDPTTSDPIPFDQRGVGFPRVFDNTIDIGAYQTQATATSLAASSASAVYGGTTTLTATLTSDGDPIAGELVDFHINGVDRGTATTDVNGLATLNNASTGFIDAGNHTNFVTASFAGDSNFAASNGSAGLTVTPAPLTIVADDQGKVYGQANPTLTGTVSGVLNGDDVAADYTTTAGQFSDVQVGGYAITLTGLTGTKAGDYSTTVAGGSFTPATLTVTPAPLTIVADEQSKVYGQANPTLTGSVNGILNGDDVAADYTTTAGQFSDVQVGGYAITLNGLTGAKALDYSTTVAGGSFTPATLTVTPAPLTIVADDQGKVYGQANPTLTGTVSGVLNGDDVAADYTTTAGQFSDVQVGGYAITLNGLTGAKALDYSTTVAGGSFTPATLTVTPAPLTIVADEQSKVYGQANPTLTGSVNGILNGDDVAADYTTTAGQFSDVQVGGYAITLTGLTGTKAGDYSTTVAGGSFTPGVLTVTPAPLTIAADDQSKVYGQANPTLTGIVTGILNGDDVVANYTTSATQFSDVQAGGYAITLAGLTGAKAPDYSTTVAGGSFTPGVLTVTPAPLTVVAADQTKVYGQANPSFTGTVTGVLNGDDVAANYSTAAGQFSDVGGYAITFAGLAGSKASDYSPTVVGGSFTPGTLSVTPAPLTVVAADQSKVYGHSNPSFTGTVTGVLNGDDVAASYSTNATQFSDVGGFAITFSGLTGAKAPDYSTTVAGGSFTPGVLTVTPAPLTVVAANQSKVYGQANPPLTGTITGILNGDDVGASYASTAGPFSDVVNGGYPITLAGLTGAKAGDYSPTVAGGSFTPGTLTVTPAPLTVQVANQSKVYGQVNPPATGVFQGVLNGDGVSVNFGTAATPSSHVQPGGYAITATGLSGAKSGDYSLSVPGASVANGTLTIAPAPLTIAADNLTKIYGAAVPRLTASYFGFVNGDTPASLTTPVSLSTTASPSSHVGQYPIAAAGASSGDYAISFLNGSLSVTPAPLIVTADNAVIPFNGPLPTFTATYRGFVNGDTPANLTTPVSLSTTATGTSAAGAYLINVNGGSSPDYTIVGVPGILEIQDPVLPTYDPGEAAFVTSLYENLVGRAPESTALGTWTTRLSQGVPPRTVALRIYNSPEARSFRAHHHGHGITLQKALTVAKRAQRLARA